jgi:hypothetical protein
MKTITMLALGLALLCGSATAFAAGHQHAAKTAPTHHCQLKGAEVTKSKKACLKAGGMWEKNAAKSAPAAAAEPAK